MMAVSGSHGFGDVGQARLSVGSWLPSLGVLCVWWDIGTREMSCGVDRDWGGGGVCV